MATRPLFAPLQNTYQGTGQNRNPNSAGALVIPEIAQAYENDPRMRLAQTMIQAGTSTAPVAWGNWAWADGIARALQGVAGGYIQRQSRRRYERDQREVMDEMARALAATDNAPQDFNAPYQPPASPRPPAPPQMAPNGAPQPQGEPMAAPSREELAAALTGARRPTVQPVELPPSSAAQQQAPATGGGDILSRMIPITLQRESGNRDYDAQGRVVTSSAGARGRMQVMDGTNTDPGYGVRPAQNNSLEERARVGRDYLAAMMRQYGGDPAKAWAAYNGGPGRVDSAIASRGANWLSAMPQETQDYVAANISALGSGNGASGAQVAQASAEPFTPFPTQQVETPAPQMPGMPQAPRLPEQVRSPRELMARAILSGGNPYLFQQARQMLDAGMGENFQAAQQAQAQAFQQGMAGYERGLGDYYDANSQQRAADWNARQSERDAGFRQEEQNRNLQYQSGEAADQREWQTGQNALDRELSRDNTRMTVQGRIETAQARRGNFFSTPQGARIINEVQQQQTQNNELINAVEEFIALNEQTATGGPGANTPGVAFVNRMLSAPLQRMEQITAEMAPRLRQAGSGAMSDRDLDNFRRSLPNIENLGSANRAGGERIIRGMRRINDFNVRRMEALADGRPVEFMREWEAYTNSTSIDDNISFDQWQASLPTYDAQGRRQ